MDIPVAQRDQILEQLTAYFEQFHASFLTAWQQHLRSFAAVPAAMGESFDNEAERFIDTLRHGLRHYDPQHGDQSFTRADEWLQREYPLVCRPASLLSFLHTLAEQIGIAHSSDIVVAIARLIWSVMVAAITNHDDLSLFTERLGRLSQLSWTVTALHDRDAILQLALREGVALVGAESGTLWLWDADQGIPVVMVTPEGQSTEFTLPPSLVQLFRETSASGCAFSVDAGESEPSWPSAVRGRPVAFIPLASGDECQGIFTVHHQPAGRFSHDDLLLLSSLGNIIASALRNAAMYANERHLINLLQRSISQVVQATAGNADRPDDLMRSLLQVAEGLIRAEAVCAWVEPEQPGTGEPALIMSGPLVTRHAEALRTVLRAFGSHIPTAMTTGSLNTFLAQPHLCADLCAHTYAITPIMLGNTPSGAVLALHAMPFDEDQLAFLRTIAEQIGVGIENMRQADNIKRLLFELSNINHVSEAITSVFDPQRIFRTINQAASQALNVPIVLCGWCEDDGGIRLVSDTAIGIEPTVEQRLRITTNNAVIHAVLSRGTPITSRPEAGGLAPPFPARELPNARDWACVAMTVKGRGRGIMLIADTAPRQFTLRELALLSTYANHAALAMENSLLYEQIDRQLQQMELLYKTTRALGSTLELPAILQELLQSVLDAVEMPAAIICLTDSEHQAQRVVASIGLESDLAATTFDPDEGIVGVALQRGVPITSTSIARDGRSIILRDLARRERLTSSLTVPLIMRQHRLGTLTVFSRRAHAFTTGTEQLLQAMATEAAVAVHNARMYAEEREHARQLRTLVTEVSRRMTVSMELLSTLLMIAEEQAADGISMARIRTWMDGVAAVHAEFQEDAPSLIDLKEVITRLINGWHLKKADQIVLPDIRVTGARLHMPPSHAVVLAMLISDWLATALEEADTSPDRMLIVALQQLGRDVLLHLEDSHSRGVEHQMLNRAIITLAQRTLHGALTETDEGGMHRLRLRFAHPTKA